MACVIQTIFDIYIDNKWVGFSSIILVQNEFVIFNDAPLYIGNDTYYNGINGQIRYIYICGVFIFNRIDSYKHIK